MREVAKGLNMPNGVVFADGDLHIAEVSRISKLPGIESHLDNPPKRHRMIAIPRKRITGGNTPSARW